MTPNEVSVRFTHYPPRDKEDADRHSGVRSAIENAALYVANFVPEGREQSLAITKLEEVMFWANAALARSRA